jgi:hypothetical protein
LLGDTPLRCQRCQQKVVYVVSGSRKEKAIKHCCLFLPWMFSALFACRAAASADEAAAPLLLKKSGPEGPLPERLLGASARSASRRIR